MSYSHWPSIQEFVKIAEDGMGITKKMISDAGDYINFRDLMIDELRTEVFCANTLLDSLSGQPINEYRNDLVQDLYDLGDFGEDNLTSLRTDGFTEVRFCSLLFIFPLKN